MLDSINTNEVSAKHCLNYASNFRPDIHCPKCNSLKTARLFGHGVRLEPKKVEPMHQCLDCGKYFGHNCPY